MTRMGLAMGFSCLAIGVLRSSGSEPPRAELARYPTFGVALRAPTGWAEQVRDKAKTVAWWISPDGTPADPTAMITAECGYPVGRSLEEVARGLARSFHGKVDDRPTALGGTRALRVVARNDGRSLLPVEGLVAIHEGLLYLVMGGVTAGHSVKDELEAIRASWTWMPIEPPYKHLEFRERPLPLGEGAATINVPALMHTYPTEHADRVLDLGLHNVLRKEPDFLVYAQVVPLAAGQSFDRFKEQVSNNLIARQLIKRPLVWRATEKAPGRVVSEPIESEAPDGTRQRKVRSITRWALVKIDDRRVVSVNFTIPPEAPQDPGTYSALVDRIVDSIQPGADADAIGKRARHAAAGR